MPAGNPEKPASSAMEATRDAIPITSTTGENRVLREIWEEVAVTLTSWSNTIQSPVKEMMERPPATSAR